MGEMSWFDPICKIIGYSEGYDYRGKIVQNIEKKCWVAGILEWKKSRSTKVAPIFLNQCLPSIYTWK